MKAQIDMRTLFARLASDVGLDRMTTGYCINRLTNEGYKYLTVTLPKLAKCVLYAIEHGEFHVNSCDEGAPLTCFAWKGRFPRYFRGLLLLIFDENGKVNDDPELVATGLYALRQICEYCYKLAVPFTDDQLSDAEQKYVDIEREVAQYVPDPNWVARLRTAFDRHFATLVRVSEPEIYASNRPRFTGGSFAGSSSIVEKYYAYKMLSDCEIGTTTSRYKAYSGFFKPYPSSPTPVSIKQTDTANYAEVLFVPKDSRGPRVISKEPMHSLRSQMAYFDYMTSALERATYHRVNFRDQSVNRKLAAESSKTRQYATLDLKDASDRVSWVLVEQLFRYAPGMYNFLRKRTPIAQLPSGRKLGMAKLSGMGSGLTFPTMALVIYLSAVVGVMIRTGLPFNTVGKEVYVYGDDLIVPKAWLSYVKDGLVRSGLKVNLSKTYSNSHFRESCGADYYHGYEVAPVRLKLTFGSVEPSGFVLNLTGGYTLAKLERHARELVKAGLHSASEYLYQVLERVLGPLPQVSGNSPVLGRYQVGGDVISQYATPIGSYRKVRVWVAEAISEDAEDACAYKVLATKLAPRQEKSWWAKVLSNFSDDTGLTSQYAVDVPRNAVLRRRKVSGYALG